MTSLYAYFAGFGALIMSVLAIWFGGRQSGKSDAKAKAAEKTADDLKTAKDVRDEMDGKSDSDVRDAIREWLRDGDK